jgi:hypothetical protein
MTIDKNSIPRDLDRLQNQGELEIHEKRVLKIGFKFPHGRSPESMKKIENFVSFYAPLLFIDSDIQSNR